MKQIVFHYYQLIRMYFGIGWVGSGKNYASAFSVISFFHHSVTISKAEKLPMLLGCALYIAVICVFILSANFLLKPTTRLRCSLYTVPIFCILLIERAADLSRFSITSSIRLLRPSFLLKSEALMISIKRVVKSILSLIRLLCESITESITSSDILMLLPKAVLNEFTIEGSISFSFNVLLIDSKVFLLA